MMGISTRCVIFKEHPDYGLFLKCCRSSVFLLVCLCLFWALLAPNASNFFHTNATAITSCLLSTFISHAGLKIQDYLGS